MSNPIISIIVPVYNVEKYVHKCIDSIVAQTYKDVELILINDGSTDNSGFICDKYARADSRIKVIHQQNSGLSAARNAGLAVAKGEYIGFVDSDDWIDKSMYESMITEAQTLEADIVICDYYRVKKKEAKAVTEHINPGVCNVNECVKLNLIDKIHNYVWNKIFLRYLFETERFPVGKVYEDVAVTYKLLNNASKIVHINKPYYYYRQRENSIVHSPNPRYLYDRFTFLREREEYAKVNHRDMLDRCSQFTAVAAIKAYNEQYSAESDKLTHAELADITTYIYNNRQELYKNKHIKFKYKVLYQTLYYCPVINKCYARIRSLRIKMKRLNFSD